MTTSKRTEWDWWSGDGSTATADLGDGFTATMSVVPDDEIFDPGDIEYSEYEMENLEVYGVIVTVYHDGREIYDGSVWGVSFFSWTSANETSARLEEIAGDILSEAPTASDLASLMIGATR